MPESWTWAADTMIAGFFAFMAVVWIFLSWVAWKWRRAEGWRLDLLATGGYIPATLGFFWEVAFLPKVMVPKGGGDLASLLYPMYYFAAQQWQQGVVPLWNPYLYSGSPFIADMQTSSFYPVNLLTFFLARPLTYETMELLAVAHYFLAAILTYAYGRTLSMSRPAAFGFGLAFTFGGFMVAHLVHLNMLETIIWLPLILLCFHRSLQPGGWVWSLGSGLAMGLSVLAGHVQMSLYLGFFLFLYWLWGLGIALRGRKSTLSARRSRIGALNGMRSSHALAGRQGSTTNAAAKGLSWSALLSLPVTLILGLGVGAVLLLPAAELVPLSLRASLSFAEASEFSASPSTLLILLFPHFFGVSPSGFWGPSGNLTEVYAYAGIFPMVLALAALWLRQRSSPWVSFYGIAALLFVLLSLGDSTVLHGWLYGFVPGFDKVRSAGRLLLFFDFGVAVMAGFGLEAISQPLSARARPAWRRLTWLMGAVLAALAIVAVPVSYLAFMARWRWDPVAMRALWDAQNSVILSMLMLALSLALLVAWRYRPRLGRRLVYLSLALIVLDLFSANEGQNPTTENFLAGYDHPAVLRCVQQEGSGYRIDAKSRVEDAWGYGGNAWQADFSLLNGLEDVMGMYNPMTLADYRRYWENLVTRMPPGYDLFNARYIVVSKDMTMEKDKFELACTDDPDVNVYRNRDVLPRAFLAPAAEVLPRDQILARLRTDGFDPSQVALLEPGQNGEAISGSGSAGEVLAFARPTVNEVVLEVNAAAPSYLVLSETWYPGWRAYVDGIPQPVLRTDYLFRSVRLEPGRHQVYFAFEPWYWPLALSVTLGTLGVILLALSVALRRRSRAIVPGSRGPYNALGRHGAHGGNRQAAHRP